MKRISLLIFILCCFTYNQGKGQTKHDSLSASNEIWPFRVGVGLSAGFPELPFIHIGAKIKDRYSVDFMMGLQSKLSSNYFNFGYQVNHFLQANTNLQFGPSLMLVPNKNKDDIITAFGIYSKITHVFWNRLGLFASGNIGLPDRRTNYSNLINGNLGIEYYFRRVPILFY